MRAQPISMAAFLTMFAWSLSACDLLKRGGDVDASPPPPPTAVATATAPTGTAPTATPPTAPLPTLTATPPQPGVKPAVTVRPDGGPVAAAPDGGTPQAVAFPTALPSGFPTAIPSGFPTALPSGFPTALPQGFPAIPGFDAGKR
jgi:hypothetical protein